MQSRTGRRLTLTLGVLLLAFGVAETVTHWDDTAGARLFWFLSLVGGGGLLLAGAAVWPRRPAIGFTLLTAGALAGMLATAWTVLLPLLGICVIGAGVRDLARGPVGPAR